MSEDPRIVYVVDPSNVYIPITGNTAPLRMFPASWWDAVYVFPGILPMLTLALSFIF